MTPPCWCGGEIRTYFHPTVLLPVCVPRLLQVCLTSRQRLASHLPKDLERHRFPRQTHRALSQQVDSAATKH